MMTSISGSQTWGLCNRYCVQNCCSLVTQFKEMEGGTPTVAFTETKPTFSNEL